ncbi:MAG TPA: hypothetical protein VNR90_08555 [Vicinamibacterales bacterium]|jgi:hypothetical protein|nr:hypothetical protein [Vicinamibacterales bacterium]
MSVGTKDLTVEACATSATNMAARLLVTALGAAALISIGCGDDSSVKGASTGAGKGGERPVATPSVGGRGGGGVGGGASAASAPIPGCVAEALPAGASLRGVWIGPAGEVWVAGNGGFVGRRLAGSADAWSFCRPGPTGGLHAIWGAAGDDVWAVGDGATILRWNGSTWATVTGAGAPAPGTLRDVWGDATSVWVVGDAGVVRRFDGTAWHVADADARYTLSGVWGSPSGVLRVVGGGPLPIVYIDPGAEAVVLRQTGGQDGAWTREAAFGEARGVARFDRISGTSDGNVWACGIKNPSGAAAGFAYAVHFDGATWSVRAASSLVPGGAPEEVLHDREFTDVAVGTPDAPAGAWFAAGFLNAVRFDGAAWSSDDPVATGLDAIDVRGDAMWAAGGDGKIVRWNGQAWEISRPAVPLPPQ